jgi:hypothetical protein
MQAVDPDLGPVMPVPAEERAAPAAPAAAPAAADAPHLPLVPDEPPASPAALPTGEPAPAPPADRPTVEPAPRRSGVRSLAEFDPPLPPPARAEEEVAAVFAWTLEQDPLIPNNLPRLETIHASVFHAGAAGRLGYKAHILLQVADDLALHDGQEALQAHLEAVAAAYRRAALTYGRTADGKPEELDVVLWRMASFASRLRLESWVYQSRHGGPPQLLAMTRRPRPRQKR